jgi:DNA modification methylase
MKLTQSRKAAFKNGLAEMKRRRPDKLLKSKSTVGGTHPTLYTSRGMPTPNQIIQGDSIKVLNDGPVGWVDTVFADPPFNIGYLYHGYNDERKAEDYLQFSRDWMKAVKRSLKPNGSFFLAIGDDYAADLCVIARRELGFNLRNWIIWHYTFGQQPKAKFARSHTHILYFTMDEKNFTFNADAVRVASARQTTYGDARANPKGKLPDDVWYLRPQEASAAEEQLFNTESDVWNVSRVCGTFKEREGWHGCQMPLEVLNRIVRASTNPGDIVLDPFNGSGTTCVAAAALGRQYVGIDQSEEYVGFARKRLEHALAQAALSSAPVTTEAITSIKRDSRVMTPTDAFGRQRVPRRGAKSA